MGCLLCVVVRHSNLIRGVEQNSCSGTISLGDANPLVSFELVPVPFVLNPKVLSD